ncbi:MAG: pseudouridine synthase [Bacteroidales bacterium]|nr:pseudouridine synthase [Bacteroidales bacterium]MBQ8574201.1 pseudouridine synthase [Bacteroidales bacterium]
MEDNRRGGNGRRDGRREYGERRSHSNNGERRSFSNNGERRSYGSDRPRRTFSENGERRSFSSNGERRSYGSDRPRRTFSENGERRSFTGNGERRSYGENQERRNFSGERRSFGSNGERRSFGSDRPRRSFSEGGERRSSFGGDRRGFSGERRSFGDRKPGGFRNSGRKSFNRNDFNYFRDESESGINKMISRRPQIENEAFSDNDMVKAPIKEEVRLNKFIANSGVCSRREADNFILAGVVTVNGEVVTELGTKVNINTDDIRFNGERLKGEDKIYIVMNKPKGYVTTASDPHADKTVMDLLKGCPSRVFPVGRLDKNTTGVLMFTNDGEIAEKLTHPSYDKKKIYQVSLDSKLKQEDYEKILSGVELSDGVIAADELEYIEEDDHRKLGIEIHSGKNRIVRRIFESLGYEVKALDRVYFAGLTKRGLKRGEWRYLSEGETNLLKMGAYL